MKPFFSLPIDIENLKAELRSWEGTPFFKASRAKGKGGGVDCVHLLQEVYFNLGVIDKRYPMPSYSLDWANHQKRSLLSDFIRTFYADEFELQPDCKNIEAGDMLVINPRGKCAHHGGIAESSGWFWHALIGKGVVRTPIHGSGFGYKLQEVWRPIK